MTTPEPGEVTRLLEAAQQGDVEAEERLCQVLRDELRILAERFLRRERPGHSWQASDLVHEALLRLWQADVLDKAPNRAYLFGAAASAMRRSLVDHARRRKSGKRGGGWERVPLDDLVDSYEEKGIDLPALDEALERLKPLHPRQSLVVDMYHFGGFTMAEIAAHLGVSEATVSNDFKRAQQWLRAQLEGQPDDP
jgi:RNA polymerase sigma-70 factor, ECF subfamily